MLHLRSSNGYQNIFSINVYQNQFGSSINAINWTSNTQYLRTSGINQSGLNLAYYINLIDQNTQKEYFSQLGQSSLINNFPRSEQFFLYLDGDSGEYHIDLSSTGLYDYHVYWGRNGATSITDNRIVAMVHSGMALVHNDNFVNDYFQNSTNGVEELTIPTTIAYNG